MTWALISSSPSSNTWNRPTGPAPTMTASVSIGPSCAAAVLSTSWFSCGSMVLSADELLQLVRLVLPFVGIGRSGLALGDAFPARGLRELHVELDEAHLVRRHVLFGVDRVDRALGDADRAVDAFVRVDHQHVRPFAEAVHGADVHAVGVLAADTGFGDDVGHCCGRGSGETLDFIVFSRGTPARMPYFARGQGIQRTSTAPEVLCEAVSTSTRDPRARERA